MSGKSKELEIVILPEAANEIAADPELANAMKDMFAAFHQANAAVQSGQYASFEDAMEAITGSRPEPVDLDEEPSP